ncbi:MAG: aspartate carbamoyltransferase regulatory subunit [Clostridiales bacterium]|jgi:aspartate carbamoyltransferase regulatory subunit|nr:aspartate carbamoyltransferase regulatory subunit [Clostridiales bacterium]
MSKRKIDGDTSVLKIDSIQKGIVIDHIAAGMSMLIYRYLNLDALDCTVAIIRNVKSAKLTRKDIIKIENIIDLDLNVLGYLDSNITVNKIENGVITEKMKLTLPEKIRNVEKCKNPRCITSTETGIDHVFILADKNTHTYRCVYCEQEAAKLR